MDHWRSAGRERRSSILSKSLLTNGHSAKDKNKEEEKMKVMKRWGAAMLAAILAMSLTACGSSKEETTAAATTAAATTEAATTAGEETTAAASGVFEQADAPTFNIILAHATAEGQRGALNCTDFKEKIEAASSGKITVEVYPNGQLGTDRELFESTQNGTIQMCWQTNAPHVGFVPEIAILDQPMAFDSLEIAEKALANGTELRTTLEAAYNKVGIELANIYPYTYRTMTSNKAVNTMEDFKGINLRTMDNKFHMKFWAAVGCNATPLAWGETYIALQQGLMDAQENPIDNILPNKMAEVQKYVIRTDHVLFPSIFAMNKDFYDSMPAEYQQLVKDTLTEIAAETMAGRAASEQDQLDVCVADYDMEIIELDAEVLAAMKVCAEPVWEDIFAAVGDEVANAFKNTMAKIQ